jgi:hypothetical protein
MRPAKKVKEKLFYHEKQCVFEPLMRKICLCTNPNAFFILNLFRKMFSDVLCRKLNIAHFSLLKKHYFLNVLDWLKCQWQEKEMGRFISKKLYNMIKIHDVYFIDISYRYTAC